MRNVISSGKDKCDFVQDSDINCNKNIEDPKRIAFVFASNIHPGLIFDKEIELSPFFYEEYEELKPFITIKCPTLKCKTTFNYGYTN